MKKWILLLITVMMLVFFSIGASAECNHVWERYTYGDREYNDTHHYACYECKNCYENKFELEPHNFEDIPYDYGYWDENTCDAKYLCKSCKYLQRRHTSHDWKPISGKYTYENSDNTYHEKTMDYECSHCESTHSFGTKEKHTYRYHKSGSFISYRCTVCDYDYDNKYIVAKWTVKTSTKKGKKATLDAKTIGLYNDTINKYKVISDKKSLSVKRISKTKIKLTAKKKGTAKLKITLRSGAVYTYVIKVK